MGGKGSGRKKGFDTERLQLVYRARGERKCFTIYVIADEFDVIKAYCQHINLPVSAFIKKILSTYFVTRGNIADYIMWSFNNSQYKYLSNYLKSVISRILMKNEYFQEFLKSYENEN